MVLYPEFVLQDSVSPVGIKIPTVKILMKEMFASSAEELYSIFTTKEVSSTFEHQATCNFFCDNLSRKKSYLI